MATIAELLKKGYPNLSAVERQELIELMAQDAKQDAEKLFKDTVEEIKKLITGKGLELADVAKALAGQATGADVVFFKVPYKDSKNSDKEYLWWFGKSPVGKSGAYYKKLKSATEAEKRAWATPEGLEWLESEQGKEWLKAA
ncbi:hypothetical protein [Paraburkholderia silvatlantica]|uniref:DNA-binding protein H-NS n=1 Tax=Paraburkholderia silvatlantica TaxID=321895 RepID=A0ABR6FM88_9BURK|nr:hypothetical protein [Paraburkholderia silvatlantica]MBB2928537.1 hypothetical protein [Paraburkholderia silvatlantica]PVY23583.1 hypothetical protein C7411_12869 [Paraburkholderia silvatlantica]PXW30821.1 hypothetical protein C7413_12769 [Paraburkholderia silvatlantica]